MTTHFYGIPLDMTSFPSILVIKGNGLFIRRKYQKLLPIQKFYMMRIVKILSSNMSSELGKLTWSESPWSIGHITAKPT